MLAATFMISHTHLFGVKQVHQHMRGQQLSDPEFQTPGLYRYVRHPLILGFLIAFWATPHMTVGHLVFAVAATGYSLVGLLLEERDLIAQFGERYERYREQVPMIVPGLGRNQPTEDKVLERTRL